MSTLLTPIITQMELDRDRFKALVNGTDTDTVVLEGRTELSIAGQVIQRIDFVAANFLTARDEAVQAALDANTAKSDTQLIQTDVSNMRDDVFSYLTSAEGARDQTISVKNDTDQVYTDTVAIRDATQTLKNATQVLHDTTVVNKDAAVDANNNAQLAASAASASESNAATSASAASASAATIAAQASDVIDAATSANLDADRAEDAANGIVDTITTRLAKPPAILFPAEAMTVEPGRIPFVISYPVFYANSVKWTERDIEVETFDGTDWVLFANYTTSNLDFLSPENTPFITTNEYVESEQYRFRAKDNFALIEDSNSTYSSSWTEYVTFSTSTVGAGVSPITPPDIIVTEAYEDILLDASSFTDPVLSVYWVIYDTKTSRVEHMAEFTNADGLTIDFPYKRMIKGATYRVYCRVVTDDGSGGEEVSEWSTPVTFSKPASSSYSKDFTFNKDDVTYGEIDAREAEEFIFDNSVSGDEVDISIINMPNQPKFITIKGNVGVVTFDTSLTEASPITLGATFTRMRVINTPDGIYLIEEISV